MLYGHSILTRVSYHLCCLREFLPGTKCRLKPREAIHIMPTNKTVYTQLLPEANFIQIYMHVAFIKFPCGLLPFPNKVIASGFGARHGCRADEVRVDIVVRNSIAAKCYILLRI